MNHSITPEQYARIIAKITEPDLEWDNPAEYDLLDRDTLVESAKKILDRLAWSGFVVQELDDLALDEFELDPNAPPRPHAAPKPVSPMHGITRWHVDAGAVVADTSTAEPGVHFYARTEERLIQNPRQLAATLVAAQRTIDRKGPRHG